MLTQRDIGGVAGILEGEGSFIIRPSERKGRYYILAKMQSTDEDTICRIHSVTGLGKMNGPYCYGKSNKLVWSWYTIGKDAAALMMTLYPMMSERRQGQIKYCLNKWRSHPYSWKKN